MTFNEANTVEQMILDAATRLDGPAAVRLCEDRSDYAGSLGGEFRPARWDYLPAS